MRALQYLVICVRRVTCLKIKKKQNNNIMNNKDDKKLKFLKGE